MSVRAACEPPVGSFLTGYQRTADPAHRGMCPARPRDSADSADSPGAAELNACRHSARANS